jgi:hypothetical protein
MNYKQFVQKLFMAWGLMELAIIIFSTLSFWADTTLELDKAISSWTLVVAVIIGLIFLIVTTIVVLDND